MTLTSPSPSTSTDSLGRLEHVELRQVWETEPRGFTPWLARPENIALLGDAIHLELEVDSTEKGVGPYRADILCKDAATSTYVLIENQLEPTDHIHLGQLLTYAAGLDAATIVWVAKRFTDEHRAALDWLNAITDNRFNFFGLEIELWRIGASPVAPKFNAVCQPNDWKRMVKESTGAGGGGALSTTKQIHLEFWTQFRQFMDDRQSPVKVGKPSSDHYKIFAIGRAYFQLFAINGVKDGYASVYLSISGPNAKTFYGMIAEKYRAQVDSAISSFGVVSWRELPDKKESQILVRRSATPADRDTWPELNDWFARCLETMRALFAPIVTTLDA